MRAVDFKVVPEFRAHVVGDEARDIRGAGEAHQVGHSRSHRGGLEALGLCDDPGGHVPAIAPAHHAQPLRVGHSRGDDFVHAGHQVPVVAAAPILVVGVAEFLAVARRAAGVGAQYGVTLRRERSRRVQRPVGDETLHEHARGPAVNHHHQRVVFSFLVANWVGEQPFDLRAVTRFPPHNFGVPERMVGQVHIGSTHLHRRKAVQARNVRFRRVLGSLGGEARHHARGIQIDGPQDAVARVEIHRRASIDRQRRKPCDRAADLAAVNRLAVGRPAGQGRLAVESFRELARFAACSRNHKYRRTKTPCGWNVGRHVGNPTPVG